MVASRRAVTNPSIAIDCGFPSAKSQLFASPAADDETVWLPEDSLLDVPDANVIRTRQGIYQDAHGRWRIDAIEDLIEGKYVWWEPIAILP